MGLLALAACAGSQSNNGTPAVLNGQSPTGYIDMSEIQAAYIGSGTGGTGTLQFGGKTYPFRVDGVGIGGIGFSSVEASGEVYNLLDLRQFPGTYAQGRYGFALGNVSGGDLWLKNENGVVLHLVAKRTGLMLSLGADAIMITLT
ncbi:hypothetical protein [Limobrevibacterium gyesilva]|uniref:DUF1134 domain-containing protein n=1 Tax=Limobrevibacterium gyesilva TaxID=2991712 RepID=A0AA41YJE6_9PROT|nr:hypothetical protein [Limobrevibacterium gyesilva]MCW3474771.1 hypothetical protein [Limobrevibacterium gyesilva]